MAQYNADIRIGVTGKAQLNQLEAQLKRTQTQLNKLNKSLQLRTRRSSNYDGLIRAQQTPRSSNSSNGSTNSAGRSTSTCGLMRKRDVRAKVVQALLFRPRTRGEATGVNVYLRVAQKQHATATQQPLQALTA